MIQADPSLPHQIVFRIKRNQIVISCNCRENYFGGHEPIGPDPGGEDTWRLYNDPANHDNTIVPFTYEWQSGPAHTRATQEAHRKALAELVGTSRLEGAGS